LIIAAGIIYSYDYLLEFEIRQN